MRVVMPVSADARKVNPVEMRLASSAPDSPVGTVVADDEAEAEGEEQSACTLLIASATTHAFSSLSLILSQERAWDLWTAPWLST